LQQEVSITCAKLGWRLFLGPTWVVPETVDHIGEDILGEDILGEDGELDDSLEATELNDKIENATRISWKGGGAGKRIKT